jgi:hypothetical protein
LTLRRADRIIGAAAGVALLLEDTGAEPEKGVRIAFPAATIDPGLFGTALRTRQKEYPVAD